MALDVDELFLDRDRIHQPSEQRGAPGLQGCVAGEAGERHELVGGKPRHGVARGRRGAEAARDLGEHGVTDRVAQMFVDAPEPVQINERNRDAVPAACASACARASPKAVRFIRPVSESS